MFDADVVVRAAVVGVLAVAGGAVAGGAVAGGDVVGGDVVGTVAAGCTTPTEVVAVVTVTQVGGAVAGVSAVGTTPGATGGTVIGVVVTGVVARSGELVAVIGGRSSVGPAGAGLFSAPDHKTAAPTRMHPATTPTSAAGPRTGRLPLDSGPFVASGATTAPSA